MSSTATEIDPGIGARQGRTSRKIFRQARVGSIAGDPGAQIQKAPRNAGEVSGPAAARTPYWVAPAVSRTVGRLAFNILSVADRSVGGIRNTPLRIGAKRQATTWTSTLKITDDAECDGTQNPSLIVDMTWMKTPSELSSMRLPGGCFGCESDRAEGVCGNHDRGHKFDKERCVPPLNPFIRLRTSFTAAV